MADFMVRFLICNVLICGIIGILLLMKRIFKNSLSNRMQYNLWFLLMGILAVPFLPFRLFKAWEIFLWLKNLTSFPVPKAAANINLASHSNIVGSKNRMEDFTLSVNREAPSIIIYLLLALWIFGMFIMLLLAIRSVLRLSTLKKSALPLQSQKVQKLYQRCLKDIGISKNIPVYSTAYLKSPVMVGFCKPCIYLPIHLISDDNETDIRYMLLHELQHYKHKDGIASYLMSLAGIVYWFNPLVWYAQKEMRNEREIACDTSVLNLLDTDDYAAYGNTLINFAEKISLTPVPFASGISGNMKQMKRRIVNITSYETPTLRKKLKSAAAFLLTSVLLLGLSPFVSTYTAEETHYHWNTASQNFSEINHLRDYFGKYEGSFVLYDLKGDIWKIYDMERATLQVAPNSTYKIYDALFGLENGIITPENSLIEWNGNSYPFEAWNRNQTLPSAMEASVNWYFQAIDEQLGVSFVQEYLQKMGYGNEDLSGDFSSYWMESSLKISPIEQVELLIQLQNQSLGFAPENVKAVKDAIHISSSSFGNLYGKTGTGRVNGQDLNGWFIGFVESTENTYFFATNIHAADYADGSTAAEITLSLLSDLSIWK